MDISIAFFLVEMLRAGCGGAVVLAQSFATLNEREPVVPISADESSESGSRTDEVIRGVAGAKIFPGVVFMQDPIQDPFSGKPSCAIAAVQEVRLATTTVSTTINARTQVSSFDRPRRRWPS